MRRAPKTTVFVTTLRSYDVFHRSSISPSSSILCRLGLHRRCPDACSPTDSTRRIFGPIPNPRVTLQVGNLQHLLSPEHLLPEHDLTTLVSASPHSGHPRCCLLSLRGSKFMAPRLWYLAISLSIVLRAIGRSLSRCARYRAIEGSRTIPIEPFHPEIDATNNPNLQLPQFPPFRELVLL